MADERIVIHFDTEGIPQSQRDIDKLQNSAIGGFTELNSQFELFQKALSGVQTVATNLYSALIDSNERLNAELLKSQTNLASNLEIYRDGSEIVDITEKITSTQEVLRESLKQIEKDTTELVGVTTDQVNGVFQVLLQNSQKFIGQSKEFTDPIEAATASTKNWAAALGTLGLPLEQANQEIRSILQGDVNNPDSVIAKTLQISREQYDQWVANGVLIDRLNDKLEVFAAGNALASKSIAGITSNIQSFFEDTARIAGADLLAPVVESLNAVYSILLDNRELIEELAGDNVQELVDLFEVLKETTKDVSEALDIDAEGFFKTGSETISAIIKAAEGLIELGGGLSELFGPALTQAFSDTLGVINLSLEGIGKLSSLLGAVTSNIAGFSKSIRDLLPDIGLDDILESAQVAVAKLTGEYQDSVEAVKTYSDITNVLLAQTDKLTSSGKANADQIKGQIEQLQQQKKEISEVTTFREEDAEAIDKQKEAIDKAIVGLEEMAASTENLTFKAKELQGLGTILEDLQNKVNSAQETVQNQGAGDTQIFKEAISTLTELTEKQVEYGQITVDVAKTRLEAILNNNKVELEARETALNTLKGLEEDYTNFKISLLDEEITVLERRAQLGEISAIESAEGQYRAENEQIQIQLDLLDQQIARQEGLGMATEQLLAQRESLVNQSLQLEVDYVERVGDLEQARIEESYNKTLEAAQRAEVARTTALKQGLLDRSLSQTEYDKASLQATQERLQAELEAEQENIASIESLLAKSNTADQRKELQAELDAARLKSQEIYQQTIDTEISLQRQSEAVAKEANDAKTQALEEHYNKSLATVTNQEAELTSQLKKSLAERSITQEEYNQRVQEVQHQRLEAELKANQEQQVKLSKLLETSTEKEALEKRLNQVRSEAISLESQLIDLELAGNAQSIQATKKAVSERVRLLNLEFSEKEAKVRATVEIEREAQAKIAELNVERINKQIEAEKKAQEQLNKLGDTNGVYESKLKLRRLAIDLINAEIKAEESLQKVIEGQLSVLKERLDIIRQTNEVDLLEEELALAQAVTDGVLTKEAAEEAKLELTRNRVQKEIELLRQLEGQGTEAEQLKNRQELLKNQIKLEGVEQRIQNIREKSKDTDLKLLAASKGITKEVLAQKTGLSAAAAQQAIIASKLKDINSEYSTSTSLLDEQVATLQHIATLNDLKTQSDQRQVELRQTQMGLITAQNDAIVSGLDNELSLVNQSLQVRRKLNAVTEELNQADKLGPERRIELEKEATALREQLNVLGVNGAKTETELLEQRQKIQRQQLEAEQLRLDISRKIAIIEVANQRALVELDRIKAINQAQLLKLEAEGLKLLAEKLRGEAALTENAAKRAELLQRANSIDSQVSRTLALSEAQTQAAEQEATVRNQILDKQLEIQKIQFDSQQGQIDTQRTLLKSQQAYEASINNLNPKFNNSGISSYNKKLKDLRKKLTAISDTEIKAQVNDTEVNKYIEKLDKISARLHDISNTKIKAQSDDTEANKYINKTDELSDRLKDISGTKIKAQVDATDVNNYIDKTDKLSDRLKDISDTPIKAQVDDTEVTKYFGQLHKVDDQIKDISDTNLKAQVDDTEVNEYIDNLDKISGQLKDISNTEIKTQADNTETNKYINKTDELSDRIKDISDTKIKAQVDDTEVDQYIEKLDKTNGQLQKISDTNIKAQVDDTEVNKYSDKLNETNDQIQNISNTKIRAQVDATGVNEYIDQLKEVSNQLTNLPDTTIKTQVDDTEVNNYTDQLKEVSNQLNNISDTKIRAQVDATEVNQYIDKLNESRVQLQEPIEPKIGTKGVDNLATKIKSVKKDIKEIASGSQVPPITVPLNVQPANLDIKVSNDNKLSSAISQLSSVITNQTEAVSNISRTTQSIRDTISQPKSTDTVTPIVKNNVVVNVEPDSVPEVTVESLISQRLKKCSG